MNPVITLIADDDRNVYRCLLKRIDWKKLNCCMPYECHNGESALDLIKEKKVRLVISDVRMPAMSGTKLCEVLEEENIHVSMIFISAFEDFDALKHGIKHQVNDYILKPLDADSLIELESAIAKHVRQIHNYDFYLEQTSGNNWESIQNHLEKYDTNFFTEWFHAWDECFIASKEDMEISIRLHNSIYDLVQDNLNLKTMYQKSFGEMKKDSLSLEKLRDVLLDILKAGSKTNDQLPILQLTFSIIEKHYAESDFNVAKLADKLSVSQSYLSRIFANTYGITLNAYITNFRMEKARILLTTTEYSINRVAQESGYEDPNYFAKVFRKAFRLPPREYRQLFRMDC